MNDPTLPPELQAIERELLAQRPWTPAQALRGRILRAVHEELAADPVGSWIRFAAGLAAAVLLWLNLSISATHTTDFGLEPTVKRVDLSDVVLHFQRLAPELSEDEARRHALLLQASAYVPNYPNLLWHVPSTFGRQELWEPLP